MNRSGKRFMENMSVIRKKANKYFFSKVIFNALLLIIGAVLIALFLRQVQQKNVLYKQQQSSEQALTETLSVLHTNRTDVEELTRVYHDSNQDMLENLDELFRGGLFDSLESSTARVRSEVLTDMADRSGVEYLFVMSGDGTVLLSQNVEDARANLVREGFLTPENLEKLKAGTKDAVTGAIDPALEDNTYGYFYFYSAPCTFKGNEACLVLGANAFELDTQIAALNDVRSALKRSPVANDGFLFAVNGSDRSFLFYENGSEVLTSENALQAGLSEKALEDGYSGIETINGTRYYCVSRTFGDDVVVCAAAEVANLYSGNGYVLFWSILGFVLVMLLCLGYAIIVRNDFVRKEVVTDKRVFHLKKGRTLIFDRSIFRKVFPVTIVGALVIFGISFYTRTLLEISESIERSAVAIEEVGARYTENDRGRDTIQKYYDKRFSAKAKLIAYILEEDPSVLNLPSDRYHSAYDEEGNRYYLTDDEGNRLKAVTLADRLQKICGDNDLESIYLYDENGRTIATNKADWDFVVSRDPSDPSYPFLEVLDGRRDVYVQEPTVGENSSVSQYIGVAMTYYTTRDGDGNTRYVSRNDYARSLEQGAENENPVTRHRGMLQLSPNKELVGRLFDATDLDGILSSGMPDGGYYLLFDDSEEHRCLYSPVKARIGMKAEELGISEKAFSGSDYYGFTSENAVSYFRFFRYSDGNFIATVVPRSNMFRSRTVISLITVATSLIFILFLCGTVTFTTEEEEKLYAVMSDPEASDRLDSKIFNIVLPSGRKITTVKAASRWDNNRIRWNERSPEQKLLYLIGVLCGILSLNIVIAAIGVETFFNDGSIVRYILSGNWDRGLNIFALSACMLAVVFTAFAVTLIRIPIRMITSVFGSRGETVGHLLLSVIKYGSAIGMLFYCLYLFGMDAKSLLASAGVLSLVIGLGATSLIKDIIAGVFIVFEGEFRVGDIVTIDGYRGTVMDIGLRTTKILGPDGNIKIYNNSEISGVLNMTKEASIAMCTISIEYGQDIDYVEEILRRELPLLRARNSDILDGPNYLGVSDLGESGVDLLITCKCSERNIRGVIRFLNKELLQIFYRNDINVPFPNITVSQLDVSDRKTVEDLEAVRQHSEPKKD